MKKTALLLAAIIVISVFIFASCDKLPFGKKECEEHVDENADYICDNCEAELQRPEASDNPEAPSTPDNPDTPSACEHKDEDKNHECDLCYEGMGEHKAEENKHKCTYCGKSITYCTDEDENSICDMCGIEVESVSYSLNVSDLETGVLSEDEISGKYTINSGTEIRTKTKTYEGVEYNKSVKIVKGSLIKISVPGAGKLSFLILNGSSSAATQFITVTAPDGTKQDIEFAGANEGNPVVKIEVDVIPGEWTISRGKNDGTQDVLHLDLQCIVEKSEENGFELVAEGKTEYLIGEAFDPSRLVLNATYESGKTEPLTASDVTVDSTEFNSAVAGEYTIWVSYKDYESISYKVRVYSTSSVNLGFDSIEKLASNSSAGNGVYFNHSFREVYGIGDELDLRGLSVTVSSATVGGATEDFLLDPSEVAITGFDSSTAGKKVITVSYGGASAEAIVYVVDAEPSVVNEIYQVKVDGSYEGVIGAISDGYNMFTTVQQALDFLADAPAESKKLIEIEEGYYNEKLEITIPNLMIKGAGADKVTIEWDSLYGLKDAGGFDHVTDSTATIAVRDSAYNLTIEGITVSNWFNSLARFDERLGAGYSEHRALALLVQSDRFVMKNASLLGYQDTVEFFTGRQYLNNVYISGTTDFIFGTNNTTLFEDCQIHSITNGKTDGGYITAFKGNNRGASDAIVYGAIFYKCSFTADEDVLANGNTAFGRCWGANAAVAIIECEIGSHVSVKGSTGSSKNERYVSMSGVKPTDETVQFVEFGNTGDGAITEAVAGMRMLTAEEAALYHDFETIFGTINGKVTYLDPWDPNSTEIQVDDRTYYFFNGKEGTTGTWYTYATEYNGSSGILGDMLIDGTAGKVSARSSDTQINKGGKLSFDVKGGTLVTVISYPGYGFYTLNGVGHNANDTFSQYYAEDTTVVLEATATAYIYQIIINPDEKAPAAPTLESIKVTGININYTVGDELSLDGVVVSAYYSDNSVVTLTDYTVDSSAVDNLTAGTYGVVFSYGEKSATVQVTYEGENADPAITVDTVLGFDSVDNFAAVQNNWRVTLDCTYRQNTSNTQISAGTISFKVKAGAIVMVVPYHDSSYVAYTLGAEGEEGLTTYNTSYVYTAAEDCTVVYTAMQASNYVVSIRIHYPETVVKEDAEVIFNTTEQGNYTNPPAAIDTFFAEYGEEKTDCVQFSGGYIKITLFAGAKLVITNYSGYANYKVECSNGDTVLSEYITDTFEYEVANDMVITITPTNGNNYIKSIKITYAAE